MKTDSNKKDNYTFENDPIPFEGDFKTASMTPKELAEIISAALKPAFSDYAGCRICLCHGETAMSYPGSNGILFNPAIKKLGLPQGAMFVEIFFRDNKPDNDPDPAKNRVKSLSMIASNNNIDVNASNDDPNNPAKNIRARFIAQNRLSNIARSGHCYEVNEKTYQMLNAFRFVGNVNPVRWSDLKSEVIEGMDPMNNRTETLVCITCLDPRAFVSAIYGTTDPDDSTKKYCYSVSAVNPNFSPLTNGNFVIHVTQMDTDVVNRIRSELGIGGVNNVSFYSC